MMAWKSPRGTHKKIGLVVLGAIAALLTGCATGPVVRTQTAVGANLTGAHTFAYVRRPGTDTGPYTSLTTQRLERDASRQMQARGYSLASPGETPDLLVDFRITTHDRVEGGGFAPMYAGGYWGPGWGWPYGPGWGWGWGWGCCGGDYYNDVRTVTTAALTITVINASNRMAVWSGTTASEVTQHAMNHPGQSLDRAVAQIFAHYPVPPMR